MHSVVPKSVRVGLAVAALGFALLFAEGARADRLFPPLLAQKLEMPCTPTCIVCHDSPHEGGYGRFRKVIANGQSLPGFGEHLRNSCALDPGDPSSLGRAIDCWKDTFPQSDLDSDGVLDLQELANGQDPNVAGEAPLSCADAAGAEYGCAPALARVARRGPVDDVGAVATAVVALAALSVLRRRRC